MLSLDEITSKAELSSLLNAAPPSALLIFYYRSGNPICEPMSATVSELAAKYQGSHELAVFFATIDIDTQDQKDRSRRLSIPGIPFIVSLRDRRVLESICGPDPSSLRAAIYRHASPPQALPTEAKGPTAPPAQGQPWLVS
jgi:thioredoxin-like negative regulator of GroEL